MQKEQDDDDEHNRVTPGSKSTSKALSTCSGAIVRLSSLLQTSFDSDEIRLMNSAQEQRKVEYHAN